MNKCRLCKERERMITTEYCIDCFFALAKYTTEISFDYMKENGLIEEEK